MRETWLATLARTDLVPPAFGADDVEELPKDAWSALLAASLVRPGDNALILRCGSCDEMHDEEVLWTSGPRSAPPRPYVPCPEYGCDWVEPERLQRWVIDLGALARGVADAMGAVGDVEELVAGQLWRLGHRVVRGRQREVFLARQLGRPAILQRVVTHARLARSPAPILLSTWTLPREVAALPATWSVLPLAQVLGLVRGRLHCDMALFEGAVEMGRETSAALTPSISPVPSATPGGPERHLPGFPTPPGTKWDDVLIHFRDGHTVSVHVGDIRAILHYTQMGLENRNTNAPDMQWLLLEAMSREHGALTWNNAFRDHKNKKRRARLSERLVAFFGIDDGDPITYDKDLGGWRTRFKLRPESDTAAA